MARTFLNAPAHVTSHCTLPLRAVGDWSALEALPLDSAPMRSAAFSYSNGGIAYTLCACTGAPLYLNRHCLYACSVCAVSENFPGADDLSSHPTVNGCKIRFAPSHCLALESDCARPGSTKCHGNRSGETGRSVPGQRHQAPSSTGTIVAGSLLETETGAPNEQSFVNSPGASPGAGNRSKGNGDAGWEIMRQGAARMTERYARAHALLLATNSIAVALMQAILQGICTVYNVTELNVSFPGSVPVTIGQCGEGRRRVGHVQESAAVAISARNIESSFIRIGLAFVAVTQCIGDQPSHCIDEHIRFLDQLLSHFRTRRGALVLGARQVSPSAHALKPSCPVATAYSGVNSHEDTRDQGCEAHTVDDRSGAASPVARELAPICFFVHTTPFIAHVLE
jgi:hypothetical protein